MTSQTVPCRLTGYAREPSTATVEVLGLDRAERARRGARALAICWGSAIVSVFIPIAHLLLVPGLVIAGVVLFVRGVRTDHLIRDAHGVCPDCGTDQALDLRGRWNGGAEVPCRQCRRMLRLVPDPPIS